MHDDIASLRNRVGQEIAVSDWLTIDQSRIDAFAEATGDRQWIHVDPERARRDSPYGTTVAHGFLTLSLLAPFVQQCLRPESVRMGLNYGFERVRFPAPVPPGSRLRARFVLLRIEDIPGGVQLCWRATVEIEGGDKPACVAEMLARWLT